MKSSIFLILLVSLFSPQVFAQQDQVPPEGLPSPYFVDEIHCSGINVQDIREGWLLDADEVEPARKVSQAEMCTRLLRIFGIEKYEWLSPDDLERAATLIRQSGYFQESDLSIKKSELKNHVHVFLTVKPNPRFIKNIDNEFKMFSGRDQASGRYFDDLTTEVTDQKYAPVTSNTYGLHLMGTAANSAINASPGALLPDDIQKSETQDIYLVDLYWKNHGALNRYLTYDMGYHLYDDHTYSDGHSRLNFSADADLLISKHLSIVNGVVYIGPAVIFTSFTPYQVSTDSDGSGAFLPGGIFGYDYGHPFGNHITFRIAYYESPKDQSVFRMNFDLQKNMHYIPAELIFGFKQDDVRNAVLPQDRFPLSGPDDFNVYIGLAKTFHTSESTQQIGAVFGNEELGYSTEEPNYSMNANYVGLKYKLLDGTWNVNLAASYYFNRIY